eukprot:9015058-Alexandrium_andersonii.AAC.1
MLAYGRQSHEALAAPNVSEDGAGGATCSTTLPLRPHMHRNLHGISRAAALTPEPWSNHVFVKPIKQGMHRMKHMKPDTDAAGVVRRR